MSGYEYVGGTYGGSHKDGNSVAAILVLFILLVIIAKAFKGY
ncbi:YjcZ family sporulation protein [Paenibacillus shunpengii]|uniref:YjcZ family sporulation protein n=1 Tax=Paenibacillus shunpengii TaxID=2054424 RepID=A0ABW5SMR7_9BACL|nr:sporulation protein YjcZ [Paenibacillus sp. FSL H7-0326]